jgi:ankyrin repeat protein
MEEFLQSEDVKLSAAGSAGSGRIPLDDGSGRLRLASGSRLAAYVVEYHDAGKRYLGYLGRLNLGTLGSQPRYLKEVSLDDTAAYAALKSDFARLKAFDHPNILRAHQMFEHNRHAYLVMDYVEFPSLQDFVSGPHYQLPNEEVLVRWGLQLAGALGALHKQTPPVVHQKLCLAKLQMGPGSQILISDFGPVLEGEQLLTGIPMPPEAYGGKLDARSDIFCFGASLFLLAYPSIKLGFPPEFPPLRQVRPDCSQGLERLIQRCMAVQPSERWSDIETLSGELRRLQQPFGAQGAPAAAPVSALEVGNIDLISREARQLTDLSEHTAVCTRQLAESLQLHNWDPLDALESLAVQCEIPSLAKVFGSSVAQMRQGVGLADALSSFPEVFPEAYIQQIEGPSQELAARLKKAAQLLEEDDTKRRTRATGSDATPFEMPAAPGTSKKTLAALTFVAMTLGGATAWYLREAPILMWQKAAASCGVSLTVGLAAVGVMAIRDTRRMRAQSKAQNLLEDAWTSYALGETTKAEKELGEALITARDRLGPSDLTTLASLHSLANLCRQRRDHGRAEEYYEQAVGIYQVVLPKLHPACGHLHYHRAQNFLGQKDVVKALAELKVALTIWEHNRETHPLELAEVQFFKGKLHFDHNEDDLAIELLSKSLDIQYAELGLKSPQVHTTMSYLTRAQVRQGKLKETEPHLATLLVEMEKDLVPNYPGLAEANVDMGLLRLQEGRPQDAEPCFLRALQLLQHYVGPQERLLRRVLEGYRGVYQDDEVQGGVIHLTSLFLGKREKIREALEKQPDLLNSRDLTGWGPLQWATFIGRDDIVRWLLERGADSGFDSSHAMGPLHVACAWEQTDCLFLLLDKSFDVNASGPGGWTPLFWCTLNGQQRLVEVLLKRGSDPTMRDDQDRTVLHLAASNNQLKMVAALIGAGADVNAQEGSLGSTPLHLAAERGHLAVCDCLIYNGASLKLKDKAGRTALDLASKNHHKLLVRIMKKHLQAGFGKSQAS